MIPLVLFLLFQIPQRYRFSSKSQLIATFAISQSSCFRYHKGTDFQANHNALVAIEPHYKVVLDTTKVQIFKQITTHGLYANEVKSCFRYHKGTDFQANHNTMKFQILKSSVVLDTTKVQIFKQITTTSYVMYIVTCCFRYHKDTDFQANHNFQPCMLEFLSVVLDTTKVQIFKQITTIRLYGIVR